MKDQSSEEYRICERCRGTGKLKPKREKKQKLLTDDTRKMMDIMERHTLNIAKLANILDVTPSAISSWFTNGKNRKGKIKSIYFKMLKLQGYD